MFLKRLAPVESLVDGAAAAAHHVRHPPLPVLFDVVGPVDGHEILDVGLHVEASVIQRPHVDRLASALRQEIRFGGPVSSLQKQATNSDPSTPSDAGAFAALVMPQRSGAG